MSTSGNQDAQLSRTLGALLGVHVGDSLGATCEFQSWSQIQKKYPTGLRDIVGGGLFNWRAGAATDDTDLTRAVALAYLDREKARKAGNRTDGDLDLVKQSADYMLHWLTGPWPTPSPIPNSIDTSRFPGRPKDSRPDDIGGATLTGLVNYEATRNPFTCGAGPGRAGNGSLMRCIPTALFTPDKKRRMIESAEIGRVTHDDERCVAACVVYNEIIQALVGGEGAEEAIKKGTDSVKEGERLGLFKEAAGREVLRAIEAGKGLDLKSMADQGPGDAWAHRPQGFVLLSLELAIAALCDERGLEDVLVDVVRLGGDTDTNGAICGGMLGARDGVERIPQRWRDRVQFGREFEGLVREMVGWQRGG